MRSISLRAEPRYGIAFVAISGVLWGTIGIAAQAIYQQTDIAPLAVGFWRLALGFPCVALACWFFIGKSFFRIERRHTLKMLVIGVMLALYQVAYFSAIRYVGVTIATLITLCTAPVIVSLLSAAILKEEFTQNTLASLSLAVLGTGLLIGAPGEVSSARHFLIGVSLAFVSALGYAIVALLSKSLAGVCHPLQTTTLSFATGALVLLPLALWDGQISCYSGEVWGLLVYLGLFPTALGYILFFLAVNYIKASTASILTMLEPLVATILAWLIFSEKLSPVAIFGAALLFLAIAILYRGEKSLRYDGHQ